MIYCQHCQKPSAGKSPVCPHCQKPFLTATSNLQSLTSQPATQKKEQLKPLDTSLELDSDDSNQIIELDLGDDNSLNNNNNNLVEPSAKTKPNNAPPKKTVPTSLTREVSKVEIQQVAGFGQPTPGIIGTFKYGIKVYKRLPKLSEEFEKIKQNKELAWEQLEKAKARLGRLGAETSIDDEEINKLILKAKKADEKLGEIKNEIDKLSKECKEQTEQLDNKSQILKAESEPIFLQEAKTRTEHENLNVSKKRISAKIKRCEIELRNIKEQIQNIQLQFSDTNKSKEEKNRLLNEITKLDQQQSPIISKLNQEQAQMDTLDNEIASCSDKLGQISAETRKVNETLANFDKQKKSNTKEYEKKTEEVKSKANTESEYAQKAWAGAGERIYIKRLFTNKDMQQSAQELNELTQHYFETQNLEELYQQALVSYDYDTYSKAKTLALAAAASIILILVLLIIIF